MRSKYLLRHGLIWGIALLILPLWLIQEPATTVRHNFKPFFVYTSQIAALLGFAFFALSFLLSARIKKLEIFLGGLDKMYRLHHKIAIGAFSLLGLHAILLGLRWIPENIEKTLWFLFPLHNRLEINLGSWALWGLTLLMIFSLWIKLPYHIWKVSHKFIGAFFILGSIHIMMTVEWTELHVFLSAYLLFLIILGIFGFMYQSLFFSFFSKKETCEVTNIHHVNNDIMELDLKPLGEAFSFVPGQFCFFSFHQEGISREAHPYTICSDTGVKSLRIIIKALGGYTRKLKNNLKPGAKVRLDGPYGQFNYQKGGQQQVWIGGGVGIAPFISWANHLKKEQDQNKSVSLYYCVNREQEAANTSVFQQLEKQHKRFSWHLIRADREGFLQVSQIPDIKNADIFLCGPKAMRQTVLRDLKNLKIPKDRVYFEDFDFF